MAPAGTHGAALAPAASLGETCGWLAPACPTPRRSPFPPFPTTSPTSRTEGDGGRGNLQWGKWGCEAIGAISLRGRRGRPQCFVGIDS